MRKMKLNEKGFMYSSVFTMELYWHPRRMWDMGGHIDLGLSGQCSSRD